jgi:hypothetical protein
VAAQRPRRVVRRPAGGGAAGGRAVRCGNIFNLVGHGEREIGRERVSPCKLLQLYFSAARVRPPKIRCH